MRSKRLELQESLKKQKPSTKKRQEALERLSTKKQRSASVNDGKREKQVVTDAVVGERLNAAALEKQSSLTIKPPSAFVNGRRGNENVTDAVDERHDDVAPEKQKSSATKQRISFANGRRAKGIVTGAVDGRLSVGALEKQMSSTTNANGSWADEIVNIAGDARLNTVADKLDTRNDIRDEYAEPDTLDTVSDIRDEDGDMFATGSGTQDEDANTLDPDGNGDMQIAEDQWLPTNSDEDANILDADRYGDMQIAEDQWSPTNSDEDADIPDGNGDMQFAEDQSLPTYSGEDAEILDEDGDSDYQIKDEQLSPTNSEKVAGSSRKRKRKCAMVPRQLSTPMPLGMRIPITFDKYGRPCDVGSEEFATDIGKIVRAHCRPAIVSWRKVPNSMKDDIWREVLARYVVPEIYKPNIFTMASKSYKTWKHQLRVELDKYETVSERKMNMPWRLISRREDWESFVDFCNTDEDKKRRAAGRKAREALEFLHSCGRKGIYRKLYDLEKESPTGEVNRSAIFLDTHVSKNINDPESSSISDIKMRLIKELVEANPEGQKDIDSDAVAMVCGLDGKGVVRGMGGGVTRAKVLASAASVETLRKVQQENKSLQSDIHLLRQQLVIQTSNHTSTPSNQSASHIRSCYSTPSNQSASHMQNCTSTPSNQSAPHIQKRASTPSNQSASHMQNRTSTPSNQSVSRAPEASNLPAHSRLTPNVSSLAARSRLAPPAPNLPARSRLEAPEPSSSPARSHLVPDVPSSPARSQLATPARSQLATPASSSPARSRFAPPVPHLPARSCLAPPASNLAASSCFIKNFKGRTIALGSINTAEPPMENVHSLIIEEIFDRNAELFDKDGKLGDVMIGGVINWPKACVVSNLPASSCFIRNFKRRIIAFGNFNTADPPMEDVYSVIVKEIYDRDAELFDEDGKLGDITIGGMINWPKACVKHCQP